MQKNGILSNPGYTTARNRVTKGCSALLDVEAQTRGLAADDMYIGPWQEYRLAKIQDDAIQRLRHEFEDQLRRELPESDDARFVVRFQSRNTESANADSRCLIFAEFES